MQFYQCKYATFLSQILTENVIGLCDLVHDLCLIIDLITLSKCATHDRQNLHKVSGDVKTSTSVNYVA